MVVIFKPQQICIEICCTLWPESRESCKFGEKIYYGNSDNEFLLMIVFLLPHPVEFGTGPLYERDYTRIVARMSVSWNANFTATASVG